MGACAVGHESRSSNMSHAVPIVFVVDDDVSVRESLELLIRCEGQLNRRHSHQLRSSLRGHEVLAPSCMILDVSLPGPQRSRSASSVLPSIGLKCRSSSSPVAFDVPMTVQAMKAGAVEFLTKPFSSDVLLNAIRDALGLQSHHALDQEAEMRAVRDCYASLT